MIKLVFCLRARPEIPNIEFYKYWLLEHSTLAKKHAQTLAMRRYVQSHSLNTSVNAKLQSQRSASEAFDGVAEAWFDDERSMLSAAGSKEGRSAIAELLEDESRFIDFTKSSLFLSREHVIF